MKRIVFEDGPLKEMYPNGIELEAETPAEAMMGLNGFPGFKEEDGDRHVFTLPDFQSRDSLYQRTDMEEIRVLPVMLGAGGRGVFQIVLGIILIVVGYFTSWAGGASLVKIGIGLVISGVVQALMPQPEVRRQSETDARSAYLPANRNTTKIGTRIPLLFGRRRVWGHILTFNVSATNMGNQGMNPSGGGYYGNQLVGGASTDYGWIARSQVNSDYWQTYTEPG